MRNMGRIGLALQGELIGEGIQSNRYKIKGHEYHLFDAYDIQAGRYLDASERQTLADALGLLHTPVLGTGKLQELIGTDATVAALLSFAESKSVLNANAEREGVVFKCIEDSSISFKSISNKFLLKGGD
jgi:ATP-dependent RNA circularization protein (DNA/RNA ligase family)